jgi:hypothetical protein
MRDLCCVDQPGLRFAPSGLRRLTLDRVEFVGGQLAAVEKFGHPATAHSRSSSAKHFKQKVRRPSMAS